MRRNYYAIIDANNFYVSCERVFRPELIGEPAIVTSSNGGGVILARSNEAKALGIPMAAATFTQKDLIEKEGVLAVPARYSIYTDMSNRIVDILNETFPYVEQYSVDESFVFFPNVSDINKVHDKCIQIREKILKWTGIPVSIGIARTKTLAKVAVKYAKDRAEGVVKVITEKQVNESLFGLKLRDIWGVGEKTASKLYAYGVTDALTLQKSDPVWAKKRFSIILARTILELNGTASITGAHLSASTRSTMSTGTFDKEITQKEELIDKLKKFVRGAGRNIRKKGLVAELDFRL